MKVIAALLLVVAVSAISNEELASLLGYNGLQIGQSCDASLTGVTVLACDVTPFPPTRGSNVNVVAQGRANVPINFKAVDVFVKWSGVTIITQSFPQSGSYNVGDTAKVKFTINIPSYSPSGKYQVQAKVKNDKGEYLACWEIDFSLT